METVYFGGGTPSMILPADIERIIRCAQQQWELAPDCEITLEAHPSTVDMETLTGFRAAGVTRISFGGESFDEGELSRIGRTHGPLRLRHAVDWSRRTGFDNVGLDLIYGLPGQTIETWRRTLLAALDAKTDHLSLYPLSIEPKTIFARRHREGRLRLPPDEAVVDMYRVACDLLTEAGYDHYEIANWALPGKRCRHNLAYWLNRQFYAVGVGAHGYLKPFRTENVRGTRKYINLVTSGESPIAAREPVDEAVELTETVMLRLRLLADGLDMDHVGRQLGVDLAGRLGHRLDALCASELVQRTGNVVRLREDAGMVANEVFERLLVM